MIPGPPAISLALSLVSLGPSALVPCPLVTLRSRPCPPVNVLAMCVSFTGGGGNGVRGIIAAFPAFAALSRDPMNLVIQGPDVETGDLKRLAKLTGAGAIE